MLSPPYILSTCEPAMKNPKQNGLQTRVFGYFCTACYVVLSLSLIVISLVLIGHSLWEAWKAYVTDGKGVLVILDSIGLLVISMAVLDSGKYLMEEEVLRDRELRSAVEARRTLTKFLVIITIAVSLEAVVSIFRAANDSIENLVYPALLLLSAVAVVIGLGIYQKLSQVAEGRESHS